MRLLKTILVVIAVAVGVAKGLAGSHPNVRGRTVQIATNDQDMADARAKAQSTIASFWSAYDRPKGNENNFALKVAINDAGKVEHFRLTSVTDSNGQLSGKIDNNPEFVTTVTNGQRYAFTADQVSDWMFVRNDKIVGNETMRPLLKQMPTAEAYRTRAMLESP